MKKIINVLCVIVLMLSLTACGSSERSPEEVGEYWHHCTYNGEFELFYKEYASDLFYKLNGGSRDNEEEFLSKVQQSSDDSYAMIQKFNRTYPLKSSEIEKEYTSQELDDYNNFYKENFKGLVLVRVTYDEYRDNELEKEDQKTGLLLGKKGGQWQFIRYMSIY